MADFNVNWLPWQEKVWNHPSKHRVIVAGRRCGKTEYACYSLLIRALTDDNCNVPDCLRLYVAPTLDTGKEAIWQKLMSIGAPVIAKHHINDAVVTLINGQRIRLRGADRPETLRGPKLADVVLDEYADMKPQVWEEVLEPATLDLDGTATFIGSPTGRNHFYDIYKKVELFNPEESDDDEWSEWSAWHFTSYDNPTLNHKKIDNRKKRVSSFAFRQEYMASFEARGSEIFREDWIKVSSHEPPGDYYIAVDPAGFAELGKKTKNLDDTAIAIVKVGEDGWWVKDIIHGRWTVDETASKVFSAVAKYQPVSVGIERGIAKQAIMPPLMNMMKQRHRFFRIEELTHGNKNKTDRVTWALEGRFETGEITLNKGDWNMKFLDQLFQFPDPLTHDDLVDALAYIDQMQSVAYSHGFIEEDYTDIDDFTGY